MKHMLIRKGVITKRPVVEEVWDGLRVWVAEKVSCKKLSVSVLGNHFSVCFVKMECLLCYSTGQNWRRRCQSTLSLSPQTHGSTRDLSPHMALSRSRWAGWGRMTVRACFKRGFWMMWHLCQYVECVIWVVCFLICQQEMTDFFINA